jgi:hypothetical protein
MISEEFVILTLPLSNAKGKEKDLTRKFSYRSSLSAVILMSAATKDPRLLFHGRGWNRVPCLTAVVSSDCR